MMKKSSDIDARLIAMQHEAKFGKLLPNVKSKQKNQFSGHGRFDFNKM